MTSVSGCWHCAEEVRVAVLWWDSFLEAVVAERQFAAPCNCPFYIAHEKHLGALDCRCYKRDGKLQLVGE